MPKAFAQSSGHFVFVQQSQITATDNYFGTNGGGGYFSQDWFINVGSGYTGTTSAAFLTAQYSVLSSPGDVPAYFEIRGYSDSGYTNFIEACGYTSGAGTGTFPATGSFVELDVDSGNCSGTHDVLKPNLYYQIEISFTEKPGVINFTSYSGVASSTSFVVINSTPSPTFPNFIPQFALAGDGFTITPSASSTGLFLSGAQEFCNSTFGTSTAGFFGIGTDIANALCQVTGYLFVPTPASLQQFSGLTPEMQQRLPFSYAYGLNNLYSGLTASTTDNMQSFSINNLGAFASSSAFASVVPQSIGILSTTTISKFYPDPIRVSMLFLASSAIWVILMLSIYHRIVSHKVKI